MFAKERQNCIVELVNHDGKVLVKDLSQRFEVTEDCIRKDLSVLEKQGLLKKAYGGAIKVRHNPHLYNSEQRKSLPSDERISMSQKMMSVVSEKDTLFLDVSLTSLEFAYRLKEAHLHVTVITNMIEILNVLRHEESIDLIFIGGHVNAQGDAIWDQLAIQMMKMFKIDLAFIGVVGVNLENGQLSTYDVEDGFMKKNVIEQSRMSYLLCEDRKFNEEGNFVFGTLDDVDGMIVSHDRYNKDMKDYELKVV